jgi:putative membrane protein
MNLQTTVKAAVCIAAFPLIFVACNGGNNTDTTAIDSTGVMTDTMQTAENNGTMLSDADRDFIMKVSEANMAEIDAGKTASTKGMSAKVKEFGSHMVMEHTTAQTELNTLASSLGAALADSVNEDHKELKMKLSTLKGKAFDKEYIDAQKSDHKKVIDLFEDEIDNGSHQQVKDYATKFLPNIKMHYAMADSIEDNIEKMK